MKALKTKVILSGIVLVFAFIATIGTTFAWFTVSQTATVESMTLNVTSADSLLIMPIDPSEDVTKLGTDYYNEDGGSGIDLRVAGNYTSILDETDLQGVNYEIGTATPWRVSPASVVQNGYTSYDAKNLTYLSDFEARTLSPAAANSTNGQYLELRFWVLLQGDPGETTPIELINTSSITSSTGNTLDQEEIANAVRMAVWFDNTEFYSSTVGTTGTALEGDAFIFGNSLDYDYEFLNEFANNDGTDTLAGLDTGSNLTDLTGTLGSDHLDLVSYTTSGNPTDLFLLEANVPTLITVLIYVEGWDLQADNNISLSSFDIQFGFQAGTID